MSVVIEITSNRQRFEKAAEFCENFWCGDIVRDIDCVGQTLRFQWFEGNLRLSGPQTLRQTRSSYLPDTGNLLNPVDLNAHRPEFS
jgi:hypothetical protein